MTEENYGFTQGELRFLYVDAGERMLFDNEDFPECETRAGVPIKPAMSYALFQDFINAGLAAKKMETE